MREPCGMAHLSVLIVRSGYVKLHVLKLHGTVCARVHSSRMSARGTEHMRVSSADCTNTHVLVLIACCTSAGDGGGGGEVKCAHIKFLPKALLKCTQKRICIRNVSCPPIPSLDKRVSY